MLAETNRITSIIEAAGRKAAEREFRGRTRQVHRRPGILGSFEAFCDRRPVAAVALALGLGLFAALGMRRCCDS